MPIMKPYSGIGDKVEPLALLPDPDPDEDEQTRRLREHLDQAKGAIDLARETILHIQRELRFPLASSTRVEKRNEP